MDGNDAQQALENRPTVDNPTGAAGVTSFTFGAAVVTAGLIAGLFFFNASFVMPALAELDDRRLPGGWCPAARSGLGERRRGTPP